MITNTDITIFQRQYDPETRRMFIGNIKDREIRTFYRADYRTSDPFEAAVEEAYNLINR